MFSRFFKKIKPKDYVMTFRVINDKPVEHDKEELKQYLENINSFDISTDKIDLYYTTKALESIRKSLMGSILCLKHEEAINVGKVSITEVINGWVNATVVVEYDKIEMIENQIGLKEEWQVSISNRPMKYEFIKTNKDKDILKVNEVLVKHLTLTDHPRIKETKNLHLHNNYDIKENVNDFPLILYTMPTENKDKDIKYSEEDLMNKIQEMITNYEDITKRIGAIENSIKNTEDKEDTDKSIDVKNTEDKEDTDKSSIMYEIQKLLNDNPSDGIKYSSNKEREEVGYCLLTGRKIID